MNGLSEIEGIESCISLLKENIKKRPDIADDQIQRVLGLIIGYAKHAYKPSISADSIKILRRNNSMTQKEMSSIASVSFSKYKSWEKVGISNKKVKEAQFIVSLLGDKK